MRRKAGEKLNDKCVVSIVKYDSGSVYGVGCGEMAQDLIHIKGIMKKE